jgi:NADH-quinone oxidoreductase subunit L
MIITLMRHVQEMPRMGGLRKKLPLTFLAMMCCTLAIAGVPFFSGFVSKDRILGDALLMALDHPLYWGPAVLGFAAAFLTAFYMFRMMFLTFFGEPRDKDVYDHCEKETLSFNRNVPLLILTVFTLGFWYSGSFTGQGLVKFPGVENKEWFQTLIERPDLTKLAKFKSYTSEDFSSVDNRDRNKFKKSSYDPSYGLSEEKAHHIHHWHHIGAILSIIIAFSGIFLAYLMYIKKSVNPGWWVNAFSRWYRALQNLYYMDHFYIKVLLQKGLLRFNNFLAWIDMSLHDKYLVDGWEKVNRFFYRISRKFDDLVVDTISVDGVGASVRFFNVILRTIQSGENTVLLYRHSISSI